jgi:2-C-methyl-D-erythritol 4-phosphate cytidylyltransferase
VADEVFSADQGRTGEGPWAAVIAAAGRSSRMGGRKKEYLPLPGASDADPLSVLAASVAAFAAFPEINPLVIVVPPEGEYEARASLPRRFLEPGRRPAVLFAPGGKTRRASVHHALSLLAAWRPARVLIHDGGRPWVDAALIRRVMAAVIRYGAAVPVLPLVETPKLIEPAAGEAGYAVGGAGENTGGRAGGYADRRAGVSVDPPAGGYTGETALPMVIRHLRRAAVVTAQTPQGFAFPGILAAHEQAAEREQAEGREYTDDAEIWGEFRGPVAAVPGSAENRKITFPEDLG